MNKTDKQKNTEHDQREIMRPKDKQYDFTALEDVVRKWVKGSE